MHAGKRYRLIESLRWEKRYIILFAFWASVPTVLYFFFGWQWLKIPWEPLGVIGIAVAFYLGFKNNSSYERLWEARKIWGGIVNSSRTITVMNRDFVTNEFAHEKRDEAELNSIRKTLVHRHVAWLHALTFQMRQPKAWEHLSKKDNKFRDHMGTTYSEEQFERLKPYLSAEEFDYLQSKGNKASHLLSLQSKHYKQLKRDGLIDDFRHVELENMIKELYTLQGKSERIKNFPFPRQYASANFFFVCLFVALLPFGMLSVFVDHGASSHILWATIPFSMICSWVFWTMEMIGDYSENPFEGLYNDVPISSIATGIEIDIRQMLEETDLPSPMKPADRMSYLY